jgi:hypothetical protein
MGVDTLVIDEHHLIWLHKPAKLNSIRMVESKPKKKCNRSNTKGTNQVQSPNPGIKVFNSIVNLAPNLNELDSGSNEFKHTALLWLHKNTIILWIHDVA